MTTKTKSVSIPLAGQTVGVLVFPKGIAPRMTVRGEQGGSELLTARFEGSVPSLHEQDGTITVTYRAIPIVGALLSPPRPSEIRLNTGIPWRIEVHGGVGDLEADLETVLLQGITIEGGVSDVQLRLGRPTGIVPIRIARGASDVRIQRPDGVPVRVQIDGGASDLALDNQEWGAVGGVTRWESTGHQEATDGYEIRVRSGVSDFAFTTYQGGVA